MEIHFHQRQCYELDKCSFVVPERRNKLKDLYCFMAKQDTSWLATRGTRLVMGGARLVASTRMEVTRLPRLTMIVWVWWGQEVTRLAIIVWCDVAECWGGRCHCQLMARPGDAAEVRPSHEAAVQYTQPASHRDHTHVSYNWIVLNIVILDHRG